MRLGKQIECENAWLKRTAISHPLLDFTYKDFTYNDFTYPDFSYNDFTYNDTTFTT